MTYRELDERSASLAAALNDRGLARGDAVAVLTENIVEWYVVFWALMRSGLYVTPVSRYLSPSEAAYIVKDSGARALIASAGITELAQGVRQECPEVALAFMIGTPVDGFEPYSDLIASSTARLTDQPRGADMMYSSGTTGRPKGVRQKLPDGQVDEVSDPFTALLGGALGVTADDVYLQPAPMYHAAPLKWAGAIHSLGGTVVLMPKFDAAEALAAIDRYGVTMAQFVPTMLIRMLQLPEAVRDAYSGATLRIAVHSAAPCPPEVKEAMIEWWGPILLEYYGSTEQVGVTFITTPQWRERRGSVGRAMLGILHVCDVLGRDLPAGEIGSVYFERDELPFEYHGDPAKTAAATHPDHPTWATVGDIGYLDSDGYLYLTDRASFMIISGGVNIYPQEAENVLALHEAVFDVAVIGVPDPDMGQAVKAVVQLKDDFDPGDALAQDIIRYVRDRIAHYKAPTSVDFIESLPRLPTGKLVKGELARRYA